MADIFISYSKADRDKVVVLSAYLESEGWTVWWDNQLAAGEAFIGVKFSTNRFGWIRVNMGGAPLNSFTIVDFAFAGPNEPITAGQVPEPGSLGLLALGAGGLATWRRRRKVA